MTTGFSASETRVMRFLKAGGCEMQDCVQESHLLLVGEQGSIAVARALVDVMCDEGLLQREGDKLALSGDGRQRSKRAVKTKKQVKATATIQTETGDRVEINLSESPLATLYRRKGPDGCAFLTDDEFHAGERLRADFTRGSLMPSVTMRWDCSVGASRNGGAGGMAELTDIALASRMRVERALDAVGPELSSVLVDVCCFLKGLERVERERQWPVRSAKMLLKTGLAILHRHYNPQSSSIARRGVVLHWGTEDYRPEVRPKIG